MQLTLPVTTDDDLIDNLVEKKTFIRKTQHIEDKTEGLQVDSVFIKVKQLSASWSSCEEKCVLQNINIDVNQVFIVITGWISVFFQISILVTFLIYLSKLVCSDISESAVALFILDWPNERAQNVNKNDRKVAI